MAPGCRDELLQRFHSSSAALVNSKVGCLKYRILEPVDASAPELVFESIWRDLDAVKVAFGEAWQQSHLPEGYSAVSEALVFCTRSRFVAVLALLPKLALRRGQQQVR